MQNRGAPKIQTPRTWSRKSDRRRSNGPGPSKRYRTGRSLDLDVRLPGRFTGIDCKIHVLVVVVVVVVLPGLVI